MNDLSLIRKKVLGISGSIRDHSTNEKILEYLASKYREIIDLTIFRGTGAIPFFNPDLENEGAVPKEVLDFRAMIDDADGVIICSPEYVFCLPGALKNAIEWTVSTTVFSHKPVAIIVAAGLGEKTFELLKLIMTTIEAKVTEDASLLVKGARSRINSDGIFSDPRLGLDLDMVISALLKTMNS